MNQSSQRKLFGDKRARRTFARRFRAISLAIFGLFDNILPPRRSVCAPVQPKLVLNSYARIASLPKGAAMDGDGSAFRQNVKMGFKSTLSSRLATICLTDTIWKSGQEEDRFFSFPNSGGTPDTTFDTPGGGKEWQRISTHRAEGERFWPKRHAAMGTALGLEGGARDRPGGKKRRRQCGRKKGQSGARLCYRPNVQCYQLQYALCLGLDLGWHERGLLEP